jgi:hypothetical protein
VKWRGTCLNSGVNYFRLASSGATLLLLVCTGCSTSKKTTARTTITTARDAKLFAVTVESAAFFRRGPQQGREPDKTLPKETVVKLIRPSFGYSKVELVASGEQGYVATDEIKPASNTLLASRTSAHTDSLNPPPSLPGPEQFNLNSNDPRLVPPPEDLPDPDLPAPAPLQ